MARIDENQEVIARIWMLIDNYDNAHQYEDTEDEELPNDEEQSKSTENQCHWSLGAPERVTTARALEQHFQIEQKTNNFFQHFEQKLKSFLQKHVSADCVSKDEPLKVFENLQFCSRITDLFKGADIQMSLSLVPVT
jgi:hypothetical protein